MGREMVRSESSFTIVESIHGSCLSIHDDLCILRIGRSDFHLDIHDTE